MKHIWTTEEIINTYGDDYDAGNEALMNIGWVRVDKVLKKKVKPVKRYIINPELLDIIIERKNGKKA